MKKQFLLLLDRFSFKWMVWCPGRCTKTSFIHVGVSHCTWLLLSMRSSWAWCSSYSVIMWCLAHKHHLFPASLCQGVDLFWQNVFLPYFLWKIWRSFPLWHNNPRFWFCISTNCQKLWNRWTSAHVHCVSFILYWLTQFVDSTEWGVMFQVYRVCTLICFEVMHFLSHII